MDMCVSWHKSNDQSACFVTSGMKGLALDPYARKKKSYFNVFFKDSLLGFTKHINRIIYYKNKCEVFLEKRRRLKIMSNHTQFFQSDSKIIYHMFIFFYLFYFHFHVYYMNFNLNMSMKSIDFYFVYILYVFDLLNFNLIFCFLFKSHLK